MTIHAKAMKELREIAEYVRSEIILMMLDAFVKPQLESNVLDGTDEEPGFGYLASDEEVASFVEADNPVEWYFDRALIEEGVRRGIEAESDYRQWSNSVRDEIEVELQQLVKLTVAQVLETPELIEPFKAYQEIVRKW